MGRSKRLSLLSKIAQERKSDLDLYKEIKNIAENNIPPNIPGVDKIAELRNSSNKLASEISSLPPMDTVSPEELKILEEIFQDPDKYGSLIKGGSNADVARFCLKKFSTNKANFEFSNFIFEKYLEYINLEDKSLSGDKKSSFGKESFSKMMRDEEFLKNSGILNQLDKASLVKRAWSLSGVWSSLKSAFEYFPIVGVFLNGYFLLKNLEAIFPIFIFINNKYSHLSDGNSSLLESDTIKKLIEKYSNDPEKLLEVTYLNNAGRYLRDEGLEAILNGVLMLLDLVVSVGLIFGGVGGVILSFAKNLASKLGYGIIGNIILNLTGTNLGILESVGNLIFDYDTAKNMIIGIAESKIKELESTPESKYSDKQEEELVTVF